MTKHLQRFTLPAVLTVFSASADTTYDTFPLWESPAAVGSWGNPNTATYGQTFIAPADVYLVRFDFTIKADSGTSISYRPFVMSWAGPLQAVGGGGDSMLWTGGGSMLSGTGEFQQLTVNIPLGDATLTPGLSYVIGLTVTDPADFGASTGTGVWGLASSGSHELPEFSGGGGFVFDNGGNGGLAALSGSWDYFADFGDLAFRADFVSAEVPESDTYAAGAIVAGLAGLTWWRRRQA